MLQWFNDSDPHVLSCCRAAVDEAVALGAELVKVAVPDLELMRVAHTVTIVSEMHHCMQVGGGSEAPEPAGESGQHAGGR